MIHQMMFYFKLGDRNGGMNAALVRGSSERIAIRAPTAPLADGLGVGSDLVAAISQARAPNGAVNWVMATFAEHASCAAISLVAKGFGGIESLRQHLDPSKVMYIFMRLGATKDSCPTTKTLLLQWWIMTIYSYM
jgi:hypothetical protein